MNKDGSKFDILLYNMVKLLKELYRILSLMIKQGIYNMSDLMGGVVQMVHS